MDNMLPPRRRRKILWKNAVAELALVPVVALPVSGAAMLLLGMAHAADPAVQPLGWQACYPLVLAVRAVGLVMQIKVVGLDS